MKGRPHHRQGFPGCPSETVVPDAKWHSKSRKLKGARITGVKIEQDPPYYTQEYQRPEYAGAGHWRYVIELDDGREIVFDKNKRYELAVRGKERVAH